LEPDVLVLSTGEAAAVVLAGLVEEELVEELPVAELVSEVAGC
jgi:hypothetical protein